MADLPTERQFGDYESWQGRHVLDPSGDRLGVVREIYLDRDTHQPEWVLVEVDDGDGDARFVPLADAAIEDDAIRVAHARETVAAAPGMGTELRIDTEQERRLYAHYGVPHSDERSDTVLPVTEAEAETEAGAPPPVQPSHVVTPTPTSPAPQAAAGSLEDDVPAAVTDGPAPAAGPETPWTAPPPLPPPDAEPGRSRPIIPIVAGVAAAVAAVAALIWRLRS